MLFTLPMPLSTDDMLYSCAPGCTPNAKAPSLKEGKVARSQQMRKHLVIQRTLHGLPSCMIHQNRQVMHLAWLGTTHPTSGTMVTLRPSDMVVKTFGCPGATSWSYVVLGTTVEWYHAVYFMNTCIR
jgi:hypothetical protein